MVVETQVPAGEIIQRVRTGGEFFNENGLIYAVKFTSVEDVKIVSVNYEFAAGAPSISFFDFNLTKKKDTEGEELSDRLPEI